ncbi:MATE family efflux transporter [Sediminitomix flava]|uniref:MATE family efflux transporter n=1 Tax=Sediminitomix flava TaxID=379075 RepID=UPI0011B206B6|nr:MATE family efflux transporter [Sediminitomix flava]
MKNTKASNLENRRVGFRDYISQYKRIMALGLPVLLAQAGQIMVGIVDNVMIGHIGETELAAASFTNTIFNIALIFGMGFSFAMTPIIGMAKGEENDKAVDSGLWNGMIANLAIGVVLTLAMLLLSLGVNHMGQPESILPMAKEYLYILILSLMPLMFFYASKQFSEGISDTKTSMQIILTANVFNIIGNYLLIYGKFGFPELGLAGAGWATTASRFLMALLYIIVFLKRKSYQKYTLALSPTLTAKKEIKKAFQLGLPIGGQLVMVASAFGMTTIMMGWLGETALAAHQVVISLSTLGFMIYQGVSVSTTIEVSNGYGRKDLEGMSTSVKASVHIIILLALLSASIFYTFREQLPSFYTNELGVIAQAIPFMMILAIYQLPDALSIIYQAALRGVADVKVPAMITFISYFIIGIPSSYLLAFKFDMGPSGIWWGLPIGLSIAAILEGCRYYLIMRRLEYRKIGEKVAA